MGLCYRSYSPDSSSLLLSCVLIEGGFCFGGEDDDVFGVDMLLIKPIVQGEGNRKAEREMRLDQVN